MQSGAQVQQGSKLERMLGFSQPGPTNTRLLGDAASLAFDAGDPELSRQLIERYAGISDLPAQLGQSAGPDCPGTTQI